MKKTAVAITAVAGLVLGAGGTAFAGEYSGKGNPVPGGVNGKSACSFSGRDVPDDVENNPPGFDDDAVAIRGVQSYGQYVSQGYKAYVPSPGVACRGNVGH
jgi:hypothetical protein